MSGKLMGQLYEVVLVKPARDVALAMADHAHEDGTGVFPSIGRLAWKLDLNRRTVQRHVRALERLGVLEKVRDATRYQPAEYRIDLSQLDPKPEYEPPSQHRAKARCDVDTAPRAQEGTESRGGTTVPQVRRERPQVRHGDPPGAVRTPPESPLTTNETSSEPDHIGEPKSLRETNGKPDDALLSWAQQLVDAGEAEWITDE